MSPIETGGGELLWQLHELDIRRKHHRLLLVGVETNGLSFDPGIPNGDAVFRTDHIPRTATETVIALVKKGAPRQRICFSAEMHIDEPELGLRSPASNLLWKLASQAWAAIKLFDQ